MSDSLNPLQNGQIDPVALVEQLETYAGKLEKLCDRMERVAGKLDAEIASDATEKQALEDIDQSIQSSLGA